MYIQNFDPLNNMFLSAALAFLPIVYFFVVLIVFKVKGHWAAISTTVLAVALAGWVYDMPIVLSIMSAVHGALYGLFPIGWIVIGAVFLYNISVKTGQFEIIKKSIVSITDDRRLQLLLIAFSFGAFLEGAAGFGTPVAITSAMLIGMGFKAKKAACLSLLANTAPVAFGGLGIPVLVAAQVTGFSGDYIAKLLAMICPIIGFIVPFYLIIVMTGLKGLKEVWPAVLVTSISFSIPMALTSFFLGPILPDIIASLASMIALVLFLKVWQPKHVYRFENEADISDESTAVLSKKMIIKAWSPFIVLIMFIADWGMKSVSSVLDTVNILIPLPFLDKAIMNSTTNSLLAAVFNLNWLSTAGTGIILAAFMSCLILKVSLKKSIGIFASTINELKIALLTISGVLAYAYVANNSGMTTTMGLLVSKTGDMFPLFAPIVGWLGVFVTGSDTSANALFGKLQTTAFSAVGIMPVMGIGANLAGGAVGKMISPQSIAIAAGTTGLTGREGEIYKFSMKHSMILLAIICCIIYFYEGVFVSVLAAEAGTGAVQAAGSSSAGGSGVIILLISFCVILLARTMLASSSDKGLQHYKAH
ncbi:L-lactate permease [Pectinatus haikarae]|uniref:L-lactate permease n=1 Tax=Pectinatus haikarae TaxID=349096 RepID=A0ABT9Y6R0_9FIRM|nr:lactate permease LctP family transporter [Pectinatus haikarae]MDQ0203507.1 lactate permease [Pectinatus haikarae]